MQRYFVYDAMNADSRRRASIVHGSFHYSREAFGCQAAGTTSAGIALEGDKDFALLLLFARFNAGGHLLLLFCFFI
jgi:hypothetical protein